MKRNFLKNSLSAFVFTLAIVASFAFSSIQSDDVTGQEYVIDTSGINDVCVTTPKLCNGLIDRICTTNNFPSGDKVYDSNVPTPSTVCSILLTHDPDNGPQ